MGDWKTAWDHIHFQGFLGTKMTLQFTWQGCDSLLAAPLAIDLARLADLEKRRGGRGLMRHLACFFKSPEGRRRTRLFQAIRPSWPTISEQGRVPAGQAISLRSVASGHGSAVDCNDETDRGLISCDSPSAPTPI